MDIESFARVTFRVLRSTPIEEYQPTLCLPRRKTVFTLAGIPPEKLESLRAIVLDWANGEAEPDEEFLLAYRDGPRSIRIIRRFDGCFEESLFPCGTFEETTG
jgi:hypothetical protein